MPAMAPPFKLDELELLAAAGAVEVPAVDAPAVDGVVGVDVEVAAAEVTAARDDDEDKVDGAVDDDDTGCEGTM